MTSRFGSEFERAILSQALRDESFYRKASRILDAHKFASEQHALIWKLVKENYQRHKELLSKSLLVRKIRERIENEEDLELYFKILRQVFSEKTKTANIELEELEKYVGFADIHAGVEKILGHLEEGRVDGAFGVVKKLSQHQVKAREYTHVRWIEEFPKLLSELQEEKLNPDSRIRVPTGLRSLDNVIGGVQPGELAMIMGTTSAGKSMTLTNFSHGAITRGYNALYVALEMPARQIAMRQASRAFRTLYDKFKYFDLSEKDLKEIQKKYKKFRKRFSDKLQIVSLPLRRCDITTLEGLLDDLQEEHNFKPHVIFVDSGDHLNAIEKHRDYRLRQSAVYWDLKNFAEENQVAVWTSTQAGREWANKVATAEAASESYDKSRIADVVLSINRPNAQSRATKILLDSDETDDAELHNPQKYRELFLSKHRDGEAGVLIPLTASFEYALLEELQ